MIDTSIINTKSDFLGCLSRVTPKNKEHIYKRVFDKERVIKITGTNWEATQLWLNRNISASKNPKLYLLEVYKAVELEHEYQQSLSWDQWNEKRFKEFENWLFFQLEMMAHSSCNSNSINVRTNKINAPIIRRFCELCNDSGLDKQGDETVAIFCKRICSRFNIDYTDTVRRYFVPNNKPRDSDKHLKKVIELILPTLKAEERIRIDNYINPK